MASNCQRNSGLDNGSHWILNSQLCTASTQASSDSNGAHCGRRSFGSQPGQFCLNVAIRSSASSQRLERPMPVASRPNTTSTGIERLHSWGSQLRRQNPARKENTAQRLAMGADPCSRVDSHSSSTDSGKANRFFSEKERRNARRLA